MTYSNMTAAVGVKHWTGDVSGLGIGLAALGVSALLLSSVALPLATYTTVLALFGAPHILSELRYLDYRFGVRLGRAGVLRLAVLLAVAMAARASALAGWLPGPLAATVEILLAATAILILVRRDHGVPWIAIAACLLLVACALVAPLATLLFLAVSHNLTPLGFLAERLRGRERWRAMTLGGLGLVVLPGLIATGLPFAWLSALAFGNPEGVAFPAAGDLDANLGAYVPSWAFGEAWALHGFSASVFAQCMHYVAVIGVLPRLIPASARPVVVWPKARTFWLIVTMVGLAGFAGFAVDYGMARKVYAVLALLHAWLEIPLLLLALQLRHKNVA
jgi:hypothetical protein